MSDCLKREGLRSIGDTAHRLTAKPCLSCGKNLDAATMVNGDHQPSPGDVTVCLYCGHVMVFGDDLAVRNPTDAELIEIAGDKRIVDFQKLRAAADVDHVKRGG